MIIMEIIKKIFNKQKFFIPNGIRVYAIGDIHGFLPLLTEKLKDLHEDIKKHPDKKNIFIGLGDYIDRGLYSKEVIDCLMHAIHPSVKKIFLTGNHEYYMLQFMRSPVAYKQWLEYGGMETLRSYGVRHQKWPFDTQKLFAMANDLHYKLPQSHKDFYKKLLPFCMIGDYFFTHAGVDPEKSIEQQSLNDLITIRQPFIQAKTLKNIQQKIVHGHTPSEHIEYCSHRINIDTGSYITDKLSIVAFEGSQHEEI